MALSPAAVNITAGTGTAIGAVSDANGRNVQAFVPANGRGHLTGTAPTYIWHMQPGVAGVNGDDWDIFNGSGSGKTMYVYSINMVAFWSGIAPNGTYFNGYIRRTSSIGTGGTPDGAGFRVDPANAAVPAQITNRARPTGGATMQGDFSIFGLATGWDVNRINLLWPVALTDFQQPMVIPEGYGFKLNWANAPPTASINGWPWYTVIFTLE